MRFAAKSLLIVTALSFNGCASIDFLTDNCRSEAVLVSWPATITRGGSTTVLSLSGAVTPDNINPSDFNILKEVLTTGGRELLTTVIWTVPAFEVNGGFIALMHPAPLAAGQTEPLNLAFDGGGWGEVAGSRPFAPAIAVRADNFVATSATGSITAVNSMPLRLRIDVTARNAAGESMRISGEAQFRYEETRSSCS